MQPPSGNLRNGNPSGDPSSAPRCGARTRTPDKRPCRAPAVKGRARCRMHGGASTGPVTPEGRERSRRATLTHGYYTAEAIEARRLARQETWEAAKRRIEREDRRRQGQQRREMRGLRPQLDRLLGKAR